VINDKGAYFLLVLEGNRYDGDASLKYDNAESARKAAQRDANNFPNLTRRLFKMLPGVDPIEIEW
jgi:hypothetical protein